jgi:hypothetical protein
MTIIKKNNSKVFFIVISLALLLNCLPAQLLGQSADKSIGFVINNSNLMSVPVELNQDFSLIPIQHFAQVIGASLEQTQDHQATLTKGNRTITLTAGSSLMTTENGPIQATVSPLMHNNLLYVPLRFLCDHLGITVLWQADTNTISLSLENTRQGLTPAALLNKVQAGCDQLAGYQVTSRIQSVLYQADDQIMAAYEIQGDEMVRHEPYTVFLKQQTKDLQNGASTEQLFLVTDQQIFTKEGTNPWLAASVNVNNLLRDREKIASLSLTDPTVASDTNPVYTFADDTTYQGQPCYVIHLYYSPTIYKENLKEVLPLLSGINSAKEIEPIFSGLSIQKFQTIYINRDTLQQVGTETFEELSLYALDQEKAFARLHTEGSLLFSHKDFQLPEDVPTLM